METPERARIVTVLLDVRRPTGGADDTWRITGAQVLTSIDGLFRLRLNSSVQFAARNFTITSEDLVVTLADGSVFQIESETGVTGLVLLGRGVMQFTPGPETERGQLRIFGCRVAAGAVRIGVRAPEPRENASSGPASRA